MIDVIKKMECSGCHACYNICPHSSITMETDNEGFWYPKVNKESCVKCNLCVKTCPVMTPLSSSQGRKPLAFAAFTRDDEIRKNSSSGGMFTVIATAIIKNGGVVFGAAFEPDFSVVHTFVESIEDLHIFRGSKYVQSKIGESYIIAKKFLDVGRKVLFTGTPCQIEGLLAYLGREYVNLYTQDIICHGVPSPLAWREYIKYLEKKYNSSLLDFSFRDKKNGWSNFSVRARFEEKECRFSKENDVYMKGFLNNWNLRPSCFNCHFRKRNRCSDVTLADFWGVNRVVPELFDDNGTSLLIVHSEKGKKLVQEIEKNTIMQPVDFEQSLRYNSSMYESEPIPEQREFFFEWLGKRRLDHVVKIVEKKKHPTKIDDVLINITKKLSF